MKEEKKLKMALISGASHALKYKEENPKASDEEAMRHVSSNVDEILEKIDEEDF